MLVGPCIVLALAQYVEREDYLRNCPGGGGGERKEKKKGSIQTPTIAVPLLRALQGEKFRGLE